MTAKDRVLKEVTWAMKSFAASPGDGYWQGRISGLLSAALMGDIISSEEHHEFHEQSRAISHAYSRKLAQEAGA